MELLSLLYQRIKKNGSDTKIINITEYHKVIKLVNVLERIEVM